MLKHLLIFLAIILVTPCFSQIDGDNIFDEDQIITVELTFEDPDFWNVLTSNYDTETYTWADLILTDSTGTYAFDSVGVRLKGNSSYSHPGNKKSFKIDFNKYIDDQNYDGLKKLNFSNGFKDPSCIREKIFFDVCREVGVPAPRANFANVTMNGTPWGFYTVIEQIDDQFLDWRILDDDGNMFKAGDNFGAGPGGSGDDAADLVYYGTNQSDYAEKYVLKTNEDINDWTDLIQFIDFINNSSPSNFNSELANRIELVEYLRSAALDNLFANLDSYTGSARNYYIYHNLTTGKWEWIKWDGNESFGSYTNGVNNITSMALDYHDDDRPLLENIFDDPILYQQYLDEMCDIVDNYFNSTYLDQRIDEIAELVQASVYADNNKMYTNANFDTNINSNITSGGGPGGGTIYGLKSFISSRNTYVTGQLNCTTGIEGSGLFGEMFEIFPNPATSRLNINGPIENIDLISIFDLQGKVLLEISNAGISSGSIDISSFEKGVYLILFTDEYKNSSKKIFVKY